MASRPAIDVIEVRKSFGRTAALDGLGMQVSEGGVSALLGPNGAGKTTLIRILATLLAPGGGQVLVAGSDVVRHPVAVCRAIADRLSDAITIIDRGAVLTEGTRHS